MIKKILGDKNYLGRRYAIFLIGLFICSFGVACTTKAGLGTSPATVIPYTLSLIFEGLSFGTWLFLICMLLIAGQIILLRKNTVPGEIIIQIVLSFVYGNLTDFSVYLIRNLEANSYFTRIAFLLAGCFILAFGVYLELVGDVGMLSGDAFAKAVATVTKKEYGSVKMVIDITMTAIAALLAILNLHRLAGVREGTIVAAVVIGMMIKVYKRWFRKIEQRVLPE